MISGLFLCELFSPFAVQDVFKLKLQMETPNDRSWNLKKVIILLFTIEQLVIIYIIASKKGISVIDWISNLF